MTASITTATATMTATEKTAATTMTAIAVNRLH